MNISRRFAIICRNRKAIEINVLCYSAILSVRFCISLCLSFSLCPAPAYEIMIYFDSLDLNEAINHNEMEYV